MFVSGLTPSSAHMERKRKINEQFPECWAEKFADRSTLPDPMWVYYHHRKWTNKTVGSVDGIDAIEKAFDLVKDFNEQCKKEVGDGDSKDFAKIAQSEDGETVVAIVDPFMRRVHKTVPQCGDIIFVDATSNIDRGDTNIVHFVCPSPVGGLPVVQLLLTREDQKTFDFGLTILEEVLPEYAFFDRGIEKGPAVIMTDDCDTERKCLSLHWGQSVLLLCTFHVLQAQWRWLWDQKHNIKHSDRAHLLHLLRKVMYAETPWELSNTLEELYADEVVHLYPQFIKHLLKDSLPKLKAWSIARRISEKLPTSNNNTNNYVESSFRYTKDIQFNRLRAFNLVDILSIVFDKSEFYANKVVEAANNRIESWLKVSGSKYTFDKTDISEEELDEIEPGIFVVPSEKDKEVSYLVDMHSRTCSCYRGRLQGPCKHKYTVAHLKNYPCFDVIPSNSPEMRQIYWFFGTGQKQDINKLVSLFTK